MRYRSASRMLQGLGRKTGLRMRRDTAACQTAIATAKATQDAQRRGRRAKPPPRKGIGRGASQDAPTLRSLSIEHLAVGDLGLGLDALPELVVECHQHGLGRGPRTLALGDR